MLKEPITAITDFILFLLNLTFGIILLAMYLSATGQNPSLHHLFMGTFFMFGALGALSGVISHGLEMPEKRTIFMKKISIFLLGIAVSFFLLEGALINGGMQLIQEYYPYLVGFFIVYVIAIIIKYHYIIFIIYSLVLIITMTVLLFSSLGQGTPVYLLLTGIGITILASILQASMLKIPPLNNNDIYHIVQMIGLVFLFWGAMVI